MVRRVDGRLEIESDFCESLRLYVEHFDRVTIACPVKETLGDIGLLRCRPLQDLPFAGKIRIVPLPDAYALAGYFRAYASTRRLLAAEIAGADTLLFSPHAFVGDWPSVAVRESIRQRRAYVIDADVVYHEVAKVDWRRQNWLRRGVKEMFLLPSAQRAYRYALKHSSLALLQGQDVFDAFSPFAPNPHKVFHTPISANDRIGDAELAGKRGAVTSGRPLKLCYVGRCIEMKGPSDWLSTLHQIEAHGVAFEAVWLGAGSALERMRAKTNALGLQGRVEFRGHVADRDAVLRVMRDSDLFLFCHQTPESPRCLVEALASGCPLVGYASAYARELVEQEGGGQFVDAGDWRGLADLLTFLARDRDKIRDLIQAAAASGRLHDRDRAMQRRIDLIKDSARGGLAGRDGSPASPRFAPRRGTRMAQASKS